ncbi:MULTISPECIES: phosphonate metabolism transcriptional regulator PhnF [Pontibacillus]|uniref:Phosphonate metabolism transcriptional regulator PhnF n=1 Tax=Pontibacillus chungwhensis TaxID=265426 RepID=A0ABY8UVZ9_9BACI|nr:MULTISPECIES: phosphonate metabolism transcriptional regulator PhnF [Pontibacillus]MCD5325882.1 phosphonate metabolism transcriptional regulator PhnF [Pontibacillus sp. HN14]WIF97593.1 phosphonate metabolism transcriptional regulator PhnF [Pontibacillus chungwhensis]
MLDKRSPLPMYYQIEEHIKQQIQKGAFLPGEMIPSERELSETYDVSRMTVRQSITNMVNDGILYREKGRGTFVAEQKIEQTLQGMTSFTEDMKARGLVPSSRLLHFDVVPAQPEMAEKLGLQEEEELFLIQRIRFADGEPMAVETTFIPAKLVPGLSKDIVQGSLYEYMEAKHGYKIGRATQVIEATIVDQQEAELLQVPLSSPVLVIERNSFLTDGTPFEVVKSAYRADRYKFSSDIIRK